jgi:hypothetical protein
LSSEISPPLAENYGKRRRPQTTEHCRYIDPTLADASIDISQQGHKAEIHVQLLMAMKQRELRIVGQEIDFDRFAAWNDDYILKIPLVGVPANRVNPKMWRCRCTE